MLGIMNVQSHHNNKDFGAFQPWARLAQINSPTTQQFGVPMLIAQNPKDDLVEPSVTLAHAHALCRSGAQLRYLPVSGSGHATTAKDSTKETLSWIADRFAGLRAPSDCGKI